MEIADGFAAGNGSQSGEKPALVGIRKDLDMYQGTTSLEGYPTYVIHDLYRHRFYNIGQTEYEILKRWHLGDAGAIVDDILNNTTLYVNEDDIEFLNDYLLRNELAIIESEAQREVITNNLDKKKPFNPATLIKLLLINVRLMRPDRFLTNTYWMVKFAFTPTFWWIMLAVFCAAAFLVIRDYSSFIAQAANIFTLQGAAFILIALVISKVFHEFGHAYMCKHLGLAVPKFGLRLMIILPFFYTDTNESWKLKSRKQRFMIGAGGIMSECILAICSMFLWGILDDGPGRNICFYLFVTSWISSLAINLTPFLRWDGYYMFSDLIGIPNLQSRGFSLGKWQLREWLFAWGEDVPLKLSPKMHKIVLFYAYGAWIKRTFVFLAIGILIYQRLFKILGIFILMLQLNFFIFRPVYLEVKYWIVNYKKMNWNKHSIGTLVVFAGLVVFLFVPWQANIRVPATVSPRVQVVLYTPDDAQVSEVNIEKGDKVKKGQILVRFGNSNLEYDIRLAKSNVDILQNSLTRFGDQSFLESRSVVQQQLQAEVERTTGLIDTFKKLTITAPFDGEVVNVNEGLKPGNWFGPNAAIALIADKSSLEIYAYIPEKDLTRMDPAGEAVFYPENPKIKSLNATILQVDQSETRSLQHPILNRDEGGGIPVTNDPIEGLKPTRAFYRVRLALEPEAIARVAMELRGTLHLNGEKRSIAGDVYRKAVSVLIRESGF